jgi:hypothetical protein
MYHYILIPLHAATILVGQAVSPVAADSSWRLWLRRRCTLWNML